MQKKLLILFLGLSCFNFSYSQNCTLSGSADGDDQDNIEVAITDFSCATGPILEASLDASIGFSCTNYYYYTIEVNGNPVATEQCNQEGFDLTPYLPLTSVSIISYDNPDDNYADYVEMSLDVHLTYSNGCTQPNSPQVIIANSTSAQVAWTAAGPATQWIVEYGTEGFTPGSGTDLIVNTTPAATIPGLTANSFYQFYVRSICGPDDTSFYSLPMSFNTYNLGQYMEADNICGPDFTDISQTGTLYTMNDDDEANYTLPFPVFYQGTIVNNMTIGNNGAVALGVLNAAIGFTNSVINNSVATGLYPFWDDMGGAGEGVWSHTIGTAPNRKVIIQWNKERLNAAGNQLSYQLIIDEATQEIYYVYDDVIAGNALYDNGLDATIGAAGPNQDITISYNNTNYLENNTCAHLYYTDCPKPINFTAPIIAPDELGISWSAGLSGETDWTIIWGEQGFDPLTEGETQSSTDGTLALSNLTQLTTYDFYIYAECNGSLTSNALFASVQTAPLCANPTNVSASTDQDSIYPTWNWSAGSGPGSTGFNIRYGLQGFDLYSGGFLEAADNNLTDTIHNTALISGAFYQVYVQAVCGADTSLFIGPFSFNMPLSNDVVCGAEPLLNNGTVYTFTNNGATVSTGEVAIAPPVTNYNDNMGWGGSAVNATTWFTFVAPPSGKIRIDASGINYANKLAVYSTTDCGDFASFELKSANDDFENNFSFGFAPANYVTCGLTPGTTYYLMHAAEYSWNLGTYSLKLTEINPNAGSWDGNILNICGGDTIDLYDEITGYDTENGAWSTFTTNIDLVNESLFPSGGLASTTFDFQYRVTEGCAYDSVIARVKVFSASNAGEDGTIVACKNEPFNLLAGLQGSVDLGGTWLDPVNAPMPSGQVTGANFPGSYNYDYIAGNNVCPDDTSLVVVTILNCDPAGIEEGEISGLSLYPNPTDGLVYISHDGSETYTFEVTDMNGRIIAISNNTIQGTETTEVDLRNAETGMYLIRVFNANAEKTFRVIVK
jgi:hypothetical protein